MWLTVALFAGLALIAGAVFLVLPDWVRQQQEIARTAAADAQAEAPQETSAPATSGPAADSESSQRLAPTALEPTDSAELDLEDPFEEAALAEATIVEESPAEQPDHRQPPPRAETASRAPTSPASPSQAPPAAKPKAAGEAAFQQAMTDGLAALDRDDFAAARQAFQRAAELRPGSPQSADGLVRAETGLRVSKIVELRQQAEAAVAAEDWHLASKLFEQALALDPTVEFARQGHATSLERAQLSDSLDFHIANPQRMSAEPVLEEASTVLGQAMDIQPAGDRLRRQIAALAPQVEAFSTPVAATLTSDNLTEVVVYKVGRLGTFSRHALELRPGTYTVVGSRQGFRDVRRSLVITPGNAPQPLTIRCEEEI